MICVALNNRTSLENVMKWRTEIRQVCPDAPIILVGTKADLRGNLETVTGQDLKQKSEDMGLQASCETSAKDWQDHNVNKAFLKAIRTGFYFKYPTDL